MTEKWTKRFINIVLVLLIILIFSKIKYIFDPVLDVLGMLLGPIIISFFFYYILRPIVRFFVDKAGDRYQGLIAAVVVVLVLILLVVILSRAGIVLVNQFKDTFLDMDGSLVSYKSMFQDTLSSLNIDEELIRKSSKTLEKVIGNIGNRTVDLFSGVGDMATQLVLIPFVLFYLLKDDRKSGDNFIKKLPKSKRKKAALIGRKIDGLLSTYIIGQLLVALIIGGLMLIGYLILGVPNAFLMATFSTITAIIPIIGAFLGILPALLIALTMNLGLVIKIIILSIIVQQLEGNLITPNLMGSKLSVHPLTIMIVIIISINLMGIFGAFIGMPVYLILSIVFNEIYGNKKEEI